jgi:tyrosinase
MRIADFSPTRGEFLSSMGALAFSLATGGCEQIEQAIANRPTRRNIANLASNDPILQAYRSAITQMQALPASNPLNWISQANIHANHCPHGNWWLLPWHSAYLVYFERICRKLSGDATFAIPYWNWADNNTVPGVFYNNDVMNDHTDSAAGQITVSTEFVAHSVLEPIMALTNFELFASGKSSGQQIFASYGELEGTPHNNVHGSFPGDMAYINLSPRDPIFWTHHAMLDYCWVDWQFARRNSNTSDPAWTGLTFTEFFDENGNSVNIPVAITPLFAIFDYQYEPSQIGNQIDKIKAVKTKREADQLKAIAQKGAPSAIPVVQSFALPTRFAVKVGASSQQRIPAPKAAVQAAVQAGSGERALLTLQHVDATAAPDAFVRVFVNAPGPVSASTPITDPHYAGSFGFFAKNGEGAPKMMMGAPGSYVVDLTDALRRVGAADTLDVQLVAVSRPGHPGATGGVTVDGLQLAIARLTPPRAG